MVCPTKNDHFGVFWGYRHLRKHPTTYYLSRDDPPNSGFLNDWDLYGFMSSLAIDLISSGWDNPFPSSDSFPPRNWIVHRDLKVPQTTR